MLHARYLTDDALFGEHGPRLLRYLLEHGADELTITVMALQDTHAPFADAFEDEMAPYERPLQVRRVLTATAPSDLVRPVRLWSFNAESLQRLLSFFDDGLFHSPPGPDGWLEDLALYRASELVLGLVSHQQEAVLRLTMEEHAEVAALGIVSTSSAEWIEY